MDIFYKVVALLGGLSMFLYGMRLMGDGLKQFSGGAMKAALAKVTNKPVIGFIFGMLVTCMIQSSTATIVLTVGLVGAGFMTFRQSIGIVLGANVGTAITAQVIRLMDVSAGSTSLLYFFKADNLAPMALTVGIVFIMFIKGQKSNTVGTVLVGFGILFMGLIFMSGAVSDMGDVLSVFLQKFEDNYFLGFLSGVVVTGIIQSSSAVVGILQSMASSVGVRFCGVFAVIIGVNIGDCLTTFLVSRIGAKPEQIRTAMVHVIYNILAATLIFVGIGIGRATGLIGDELWTMELNSGGVANVHGIFRLVPAVCLLPFTNVLAWLAEKIVPDRKSEADKEDEQIEQALAQLDSRLTMSPALALDQSARLIGQMADVAIHNFDGAVDQIFAYEEKRNDRIEAREHLLDRMADASNVYIVELSPRIVLENDNHRQNYQIKALTSFERIGDLAVNITNSVRTLKENNTSFSRMAMVEIRVLTDAVREILGVTGEAFRKNDMDLARRVEPMEEVVDALVEAARKTHIQRITRQECEIYASIQYENILTDLERISDQCSDLAVFLLGSVDVRISGNEHQYIQDLHHTNNREYQQVYYDNYEKYFSRLEAGAKQIKADSM